MTDPSLGKGTLQDIALRLTQTRLKEMKIIEKSSKEKTIFLLGSKGVGKTTIINNFLDRDDTTTKPTLALEFSFGRRSGMGQGIIKQVCNVWELGCILNSTQLVDVPMKSHGIDNFTAIIVLDISQPDQLWSDLEGTLNGLKQAISDSGMDGVDIEKLKNENIDRIGVDHPDLTTLHVFPFPIIIIGGKYDIFQDLDPEIKKHVCRYLRSISHTIGAALIFYSSKIPSLSKSIRDTLNHFGFGSPTNPFRKITTDYNEPLVIWFGQDSWQSIGVTPTNSERIGMAFNLAVPQKTINIESASTVLRTDPAKDTGFSEKVIDDLRIQKDEELLHLIKDTEIRTKFQSVIT